MYNALHVQYCMCSCVLCSCVPSYFHKKYESTLYESTFVLSKVILSYFRTKVRKYVVRTKVRKYFLKYFRTFVRKYFRILLYFRRATRTEGTYGSTKVLSYFRTSSTVLLYFRPLPDRASRSNSALLPTDRAEAPEALMIGLAARVRFVFKQFLALHVRVRV